jgi:D-alanyl-D-alanine dipeptidase
MRRIWRILKPILLTAVLLGGGCQKEIREHSPVPTETKSAEPAETPADEYGTAPQEEHDLNESTKEIVKAGLPEGFVYIDELIPDCIIDAKYFGSDNFMGRPAAGYEKPLVVCSSEVASGLVSAADDLRKEGYVLKIFDSYRPQSAVDDFVGWASNPKDETEKEEHYPNVEKSDLIRDGYIASHSGHTRGAAVDLTLVRLETGEELDMGTCFDFLDVLSRHGAAGLTEEQENNREILKEAMTEAGFKPYKNEWWHYSIETEPHPDTYFDFPVS